MKKILTILSALVMVFAVSCKKDKTKYTVTFDIDGISKTQTQEVEEGAKVTKPSDPTLANYTFAGKWMINDTVDFDFDTYEVKSNITVKATWTRADELLTALAVGSTGSTIVGDPRNKANQAIDNCTGCHGYNGKSQSGVDLATVTDAKYTAKFPVMDGTTIEHGNRAITQEGIDRLKKLVSYGGSKVGDKLAGEIIYKRVYYRPGSGSRAGAMVSCEICHGANGELVTGLGSTKDRDLTTLDKSFVFDRAWYGTGSSTGHKGSNLDSYQAYAVMEYIKTTLK